MSGGGSNRVVERESCGTRAKDTDNLQLGELRFRVALKPEAAQTSAPPPPRTSPPQGTPPSLDTPPSTRRGRSILPALGLIGGGVALSALALRGALREMRRRLRRILFFFRAERTNHWRGSRHRGNRSGSDAPSTGESIGCAGDYDSSQGYPHLEGHSLLSSGQRFLYKFFRSFPTGKVLKQFSADLSQPLRECREPSR